MGEGSWRSQALPRCPLSPNEAGSPWKSAPPRAVHCSESGAGPRGRPMSFRKQNPLDTLSPPTPKIRGDSGKQPNNKSPRAPRATSEDLEGVPRAVP